MDIKLLMRNASCNAYYTKFIRNLSVRYIDAQTIDLLLTLPYVHSHYTRGNFPIKTKKEN